MAEAALRQPPTLAEVLGALRRHEQELRRQGVTSAAVFGSVARGDAQPDSDVDILVDIDPDAKLSLFGHIGVQHFLADLLGRKVDLVSRTALRPRMRERVRAEEVAAF